MTYETVSAEREGLQIPSLPRASLQEKTLLRNDLFVSIPFYERERSTKV